MVEHAIEAALEDGKAGFDGVGGHVFAGVFAFTVLHNAMLGELAANLLVDREIGASSVMRPAF